MVRLLIVAVLLGASTYVLHNSAPYQEIEQERTRSAGLWTSLGFVAGVLGKPGEMRSMMSVARRATEWDVVRPVETAPAGSP